MNPKTPERRQYKNPPIEEALCAFHFAPRDEWDPTMPGRLYEKLKASYPGKPRQKSGMEAQIGEEASGSSLMVKHGARIQFYTLDEKALVAVAPDTLSIHVLRPYPKWEGFLPRIVEAAIAYQEIDNARVVTSIGLRYINRIELPTEKVNLEEYFKISPIVPESLPTTLSAFMHRQDYIYDDKPIRFALTFASAKAPPKHSAFLLDLDFTLKLEQSSSLIDVLGIVEELRNRERTAFESLITDTARKVFDAG